VNEGIALAAQSKDQIATALAINNPGEVARVQGDYTQAAMHYADSLWRLQDMGSRADVPRLLHNLGYVALYAGDVSRAAALFRDSLERFHVQRSDRGVAEGLAGLASVAAVEQQPNRAARLWGAAEALPQACDAEPWPADNDPGKRESVYAHYPVGREQDCIVTGTGTYNRCERDRRPDCH
jgi:hypothetical protein